MAISRALWLTAALGIVAYGQKKPQPIPGNYDFPANQTALTKLRDQNDVTGMRLHAWMVFAGMTQPTPTGEAVWETWYSADETFGGAQPQALTTRNLQRRFQVPKQFRSTGLHPQAVGTSLASFTLFNEDLRTFVRQQKLYLHSTLKAINDSFKPQTPIAQREIPQFPNRAVALKTVWWIVKKQGTTAIPVWDPELNPPQSTGNDFRTWKRCVAVDPSRLTVPTGETVSLPCNQAPPAAAHVVPLEAFYHFALTAETLASLKQLPNDIPNLATAAVGDHLVLLALHYTTKEIPEWVWATFWWHDRPDQGEFAAGRPAQVKGAWRNYLMSPSYSMETPRESGSAHAAFNPWLEARFPNGTVSDCMTCHQRAVFSGKSTDFEFLPVTRGTPPSTDPRFAGATKLDFLWSVLIEGQ
jgi:hypothetical protein